MSFINPTLPSLISEDAFKDTFNDPQVKKFIADVVKEEVQKLNKENYKNAEDYLNS